MDQLDKSSPTDKMTGFRKRQQLTKTNKSIFAWVAGASVIVTICGVFIQFLVQQLIFNQQVIAAKTEAQSIVIKNKSTATELKKTVDALVADSNLAKVKTNVSDGSTASNLQVILDALPTSNDGATFANSLASVILPRSGVSIDSIDVDGDSGTSTATVTTTSSGTQTLGFSISVTGTYDQIQQTLANLVKVIRPINVTKLTLQGDGSSLTGVITGITYSIPASSVNLESKTLKP